jgi:peptidoglycan/LPS O-acetylase OafA/YrhL
MVWILIFGVLAVLHGIAAFISINNGDNIAAVCYLGALFVCSLGFGASAARWYFEE